MFCSIYRSIVCTHYYSVCTISCVKNCSPRFRLSDELLSFVCPLIRYTAQFMILHKKMHKKCACSHISKSGWNSPEIRIIVENCACETSLSWQLKQFRMFCDQLVYQFWWRSTPELHKPLFQPHFIFISCCANTHNSNE